MTLSSVQICNMALSHIGARAKIENIETEQSTEAFQCRLWYDYSRRQSLEMHDWGFARKRAALIEHSEDPPMNWGYRYVYPADCLSARKIENPLGHHADAVPFEIELAPDGESKTILTNQAPDCAILVYTFNQLNPDLWSPFFVEMFSWVLGSHMAFTLTGKSAVENRALERVTTLFGMAPAMDSNERVGRQPRDADWIASRTADGRGVGPQPPWFPPPEGQN